MRAVDLPMFGVAKWCRGCSRILPLIEFHKNADKPDGHGARCRDCVEVYGKGWRSRNRKSSAPYDPAARRRRPEQFRAREAVKRAVRDGTLPRAATCTCADCGGPAQVYDHHCGYAWENRLRVRPLCRKCDAQSRRIRGECKPDYRPDVQSRGEIYVWRSVRHLTDRNGQPCKLLARGSRMSCLIQFADGVRHVTNRQCIKPVPTDVNTIWPVEEKRTGSLRAGINALLASREVCDDALANYMGDCLARWDRATNPSLYGFQHITSAPSGELAGEEREACR